MEGGPSPPGVARAWAEGSTLVTTEQQIATFSELVAAHRGRVFGYIYAMLHNLADAEDIYQQTTVLMWQKFNEFEPGTDFGSWALKIAYFNIKNFQRTKSRRHVFFSDEVMEKVAESYRRAEGDRDEDRVEALVDCVRRLPEHHQLLLKRRYSDDAPVKHLAESEGKSEAAMAMMLSRLRKALFRCVRSRMALQSH